MFFAGDLVEEIDIAFIRRGDVERHGAERRPARGLEDDGHATMIQPEAAIRFRRVRRKQACGARFRHEFETQRILNHVRAAARIVFVRDNLLAHECCDSRAQVRDFRRQRKINHGLIFQGLSNEKARRTM